MSDHENWQCPTCGRHVTISQHDRAYDSHLFYTSSGHSDSVEFFQRRHLIRCPNPQCKEHFLWIEVSRAEVTSKKGDYPIRGRRTELIGSLTFLPKAPRPLSEFVVQAARQDYEEAYRIRELSPKASATLSRRALQGMIRDFWNVSKGRLADELNSIKDQCDGDIYAAMMAVKSIGNIGAHPERDVNLIVDVEPEEAGQLIDLLHLLDQEWYVARAERERRLQKIHGLAAAKAEAKKPAA